MIVYDVKDASRIAGKAWCEQHGIDPNEVARVEDYGSEAVVSFVALNDEGKSYIDPATGKRALRVERIDL